MGLLSFTAWQFAAAGAVCAAGPIIIHLLNRRRYRVIPWAAMDFLRQALKQNRRILQIRDLVLLAMRTLAVLLFGAALARPYLASREQQFDSRQPLHAVIVVDNSLSMAYESLEGSLLDMSKERAREVVQRLPAGSRISLVAACGAPEGVSADPYETKDAAYEALERIEIVDRSATIARVANAAREACQDAPDLSKRVFFIGDQQALNWRDVRQGEALADLPPLQVLSVAAGASENTWISDVRVQDGLADIETPATVVVEVAHRGSAPRRDVEVTLSMGETILGQKTVSIEPGLGTREVDFECVFSGLSQLPEPGKPVFVPIRAALSSDRLAADDERFLAVPIVAALPVVFIDQYGPEEEDVIRGRLGETRHLRKLLAPRTSRSDAPRQLISVRHITPGELTRDILADARLVVAAGLREPGAMVPLLAEFVRQGGQLVVAAGAEFDSALWQEAAWLDGQGILPLPLLPEPIGQTPEEAGEELQPFFLAADSLLEAEPFQLAGVAQSDLKELYGEPFFFKAIEVGASRQTRARGEVLDGETERRSDVASELRPRILGRYDLPRQPPFLVARRIGRGEVVFCTSGLLSSWNTLPKTNAILIFDRLFRRMIQNTLPQRNLQPSEQFVLPLPAEEQNLQVVLERPGQTAAQPLDVTYVGAQQRGVAITGLLKRGVYRARGFRPQLSPDAARGEEQPVWDVQLVVGGESEESDLTPLARGEIDKLAALTSIAWVAPGEPINLAGAAIRGQNSWWYLAGIVLVLLVAEMLILVTWGRHSGLPDSIRQTGMSAPRA